MAEGALTTEVLVPAGRGRASASGTRVGRRRFGGARVAAAESGVRPRGVGALLDAAADALVGRFALLVGFAVLIGLPVQVFQTALNRALPPSAMGLMHLVPAALQSITGFLVGLWATALVGAHLLGREVGVVEGLRRAFDRPLSLVVLAFVTGVLFVVQTLSACCIAPYFLVAWLFSVVSPVYVLERATPFAALGRSVALVKSSFARWLGLFVTQLFVVQPSVVLGSQLTNPEYRPWIMTWTELDSVTYDLIATPLSALFLGLGATIVATVHTVYYVDVRCRVEGLDLRLRLRAQPGAAPDAAEPDAQADDDAETEPRARAAGGAA